MELLAGMKARGQAVHAHDVLLHQMQPAGKGAELEVVQLNV